MNKNRLRAINATAVGPRNSMSGPLASSQQREQRGPHFNTPSEPAPKRQKRSSASEMVVSKFFPKTNPKARNDAIEEVSEDEFRPDLDAEQGEGSKREVHDLTQDGSQADTNDLASTTSAGRQSASAGLAEYRRSIPKMSGNRRPLRRSRAMKARSSSQDGNEIRSSRDDLSPEVSQVSIHSADEMGQDTPLTCVGSDIPTQSNSVNRSQPITKRKRLSAGMSGGSEDELAGPGTLADEKKPTNFSNLPKRKLKSRADMTQTHFGSSKSANEGRVTLSSQPSLPDACVARAVSGKFTYCLSPLGDRPVKLHFGDSIAKVIYETGGTTRRLPWLDIQRSKVISVMHAATHSPFIIIKRSSTHIAAPDLAVEFEENHDVVSFINWLSEENIRTIEMRPADTLKRMFNNHFEETDLYEKRSAKQVQAERPEILQKVHFFNTFFFAKLKPSRGKINYEGVKSWTAKVDLLSYDYIVVPVNENMHWYLAIIYNAPRMLADGSGQEPYSDPEAIDLDQPTTRASQKKPPVDPDLESILLDDDEAKSTARSQSSNGTIDVPLIPPTKPTSTTTAKTSKRKSTGGPQKFSWEEPKIITLDSLGSSHSVTCRHLKDYLVEEARHKKNVELAKIPGGMTAKRIPEQDNHCDCGVFVLGYMEEFLKDPDGAVRKLLQKEDMGWNIKPFEIRAKVRDLLFTLQKEQEDRVEAEKARKRQRKLAKEAVSSGPSASQSGQSSPREPPESSKTPQSKPEIMSPLANGIKSPAVAALQRVMSTPASPRQSFFPDKPPQPCTPKIGEDPKFIVALDDDSSLDAKTSGSIEVLHSARSSPRGASRVPVDLTTGEPDNAIKGTPNKRSKPSFVEKLPSSPPNAPPSPESRAVKRSRSESLEITHVEKRRSQKLPSVQPRGLTLSQRVIMPSIEGDKTTTGGPKYDGIDRSVDISS
ncbi:hypothetical protein G7Z17_g9389 [Cylindrodendrum hubeiense]|uniref:Ubiquitin-like protease family profile domain-containing protein n=1 Tax=Cylindrodendrum hubeiense TaxID=595255 RepID=A0A9P5H6V4_9HYPO|nr:hypothetical protein G7Z17_g9389 [Cylindrodendrum hubeiense]